MLFITSSPTPRHVVYLLFLHNTRHDPAQDLYLCCTLARNVLAPNMCVAQALITLGSQLPFSEVIPDYPITFSQLSDLHYSIIFHHLTCYTLHIYIAHSLLSASPRWNASSMMAGLFVNFLNCSNISIQNSYWPVSIS